MKDSQKRVHEVTEDAPRPEAFNHLIGILQEESEQPLFDGNAVELLIDGPETYASMLEAIHGAESSVLLETYIFYDDSIGRKFADALRAAAKRGVGVYLIYDSFGSRSANETMFDDLRDAGVKVVEFQGLNPFDGGEPHKANTRTHRKILVVDEWIAFTGGLNIAGQYRKSSDETVSDPLKAGWRDTHVRITGSAAGGFVNVFRENWYQEESERLALEAAAQRDENPGTDLVAVLSAEGDERERSPIYYAYRAALTRATERIWITQAYFVPDEEFYADLINAAERGVDVQIIVPGVTDSKAVLHASRSRYGKLLKAGVRLHENRAAVLHAKTAVIDSIWSTVGSSNLDYRSFLHNDEVNAVVLGTDFGTRMDAQFRDDVEQCAEVSYEAWKKRPFTDRFREVASRLIEYWL